MYHRWSRERSRRGEIADPTEEGYGQSRRRDQVPLGSGHYRRQLCDLCACESFSCVGYINPSQRELCCFVVVLHLGLTFTTCSLLLQVQNPN